MTNNTLYSSFKCPYCGCTIEGYYDMLTYAITDTKLFTCKTPADGGCESTFVITMEPVLNIVTYKIPKLNEERK